MDILLNVILPVFLVIGIGYISTWRQWFSTENIDSLTRFAQSFAIPCLLFYAIAKIEISEAPKPRAINAFINSLLSTSKAKSAQ